MKSTEKSNFNIFVMVRVNDHHLSFILIHYLLKNKLISRQSPDITKKFVSYIYFIREKEVFFFSKVIFDRKKSKSNAILLRVLLLEYIYMICSANTVNRCKFFFSLLR
jgi:hypothetical protein